MIKLTGITTGNPKNLSTETILKARVIVLTMQNGMI